MIMKGAKTDIEQEVLHLTLDRMGRMGDVYAEHEGSPVYVLGGVPGEEVRAKVIGRRRRYAIAQVLEVLRPSPSRVTPPCVYFGSCTGCQWQHIDYQRQLELKRQAVEIELHRLPELEGVKVSPTLPSPGELHYRNHARFSIGPQGTLGFVNRATRRFVEIRKCLLMDPWINGALEKLQDRCEETTQLSIRCGVNTGDVLVQPTLQNPDITIRSGQTHYEESMLGRRFRIASSSFFQVNTPQAENVVHLLKERLRLTGKELLVDAYAGVGTFAVLLAPYCRKVIAIEESTSAVKDAAINTLDLQNIEFREGKTEAVIESIEERPEAVILDPPRAGCHQNALELLKRLAPERVCYVSCDPETLARDLAILCQDKYKVEDVQPVDMFPQTYHTECIATLSL